MASVGARHFPRPGAGGGRQSGGKKEIDVARRNMQDLPKGARFIGPDGTEYEVTTPASEHRNGWVNVRDLSMTEDEAQRRLATPGAVEPGEDPRDGFFSYTQPVEVEVVQ